MGMEPCLNRTSVGLKLSYSRGGASLFAPPQSNQRGIETFGRLHNPELHPSTPQSNQRGIETDEGTALYFRTV